MLGTVGTPTRDTDVLRHFSYELYWSFEGIKVIPNLHCGEKWQPVVADVWEQCCTVYLWLQRGGWRWCARTWTPRRRSVCLMEERYRGERVCVVSTVAESSCTRRAANRTDAPGAEPRPRGPASCPNTLPSAARWYNTRTHTRWPK